jgi:hypothetical protein
MKKKSNKKCQNWLCPPEIRAKCTDEITDRHHLYPQTQQNRRQYGSLLDESFNIINVSNRCHLNKTIPTYNEIEFREAGEKAGFRMPPASKSLQFKKF